MACSKLILLQAVGKLCVQLRKWRYVLARAPRYFEVTVLVTPLLLSLLTSIFHNPTIYTVVINVIFQINYHIHSVIMATLITTSLGDALPPYAHHAITVHMPKWQSMIRFADRDPEFMKQLKSMYPRE